MSDAELDAIRRLQVERNALIAAKKKASREVHEAMQTSSSKMATADNAESLTADGLSIRINEESRLDDTVEGSKNLPETKNQSAIWTAHIFLLPNKSLQSPLQMNSNAYDRCLSRGLGMEVAVNGPSSEAFASAVSQAFGPLLQNRPWAPLQPTVHDTDGFQGHLMLKSLGPELIGSKYDLEFLRTHCALFDPNGKIYSVYIALRHSTLSWNDLRASPVVLPGLEASWEHDPLLDADYPFASDENNAEYNGPSAASTTDEETGDLSDLESLASVTDVPSLTSGTTFSSLGSHLDIPEATDELAKLLLKDEELGPLFHASLQRTAADKVERNYTRLLAAFAKDLRKEATNSAEHHVGKLVKFRARFISQTLVSAIDPSRHDRTAQLENYLHQNEYTEGRLEQFLESLAVSGGFVEATKGAPPPIDSDANISDDSGEDGSLPKLSQIKEFILSSKALATLRARLKGFVSPEEASSGAIQQSDNTKGTQGAHVRSEEPLDGRLSNLETCLGAVIRLVTRIDQRTLSTLTDSVLKSRMRIFAGLKTDGTGVHCRPQCT